MDQSGAAEAERKASARTERLVNTLVLSFISCYLISAFPIEVLTAKTPATGGDTVSHFWPLHNLFKHGIAEGHVFLWNPGNLAGEPQLVHYFPLPFIIMAILGTFLPLETAFNIGTLLPTFFLPFASFYFLSGFLRYPAPLLAAVFSVGFLFLDSYTAWGGNILSTLSGQFCHVYALVFFLLGLGMLARPWPVRRHVLCAGASFAAVALSHGYVTLGIPFASFMVLVLCHKKSLGQILATWVLTGVTAVLLSIWWLYPMIDNRKWTTPNTDQWLNWVGPSAYLPLAVSIMLLVWILSSPFFPSKDWWQEHRSWIRFTLVGLCISIFYGTMIVVFPYLGLVDVRAIPQIHLFIALLAGGSAGYWAVKFGRWIQVIVIVVATLGVLVLSQNGRTNVKSWSQWNYSGWEPKPAYADLQNLSNYLRGTFEDPRVIFEHNIEINNRAGSSRVFEMLPYFSGRATLESVYMQATILSPQIFGLQGLVGNQRSCPFQGYYCPPMNLAAALPKLRLFGVGQLILSSQKSIEEARSIAELREGPRFGAWQVFNLNMYENYVTLLDTPPKLLAEEKNWRETFDKWFQDFTGNEPFLLLESTLSKELLDNFRKSGGSNFLSDEHCKARAIPTTNKIILETNCPGKAHILKIAYHHALRPENGDQTFAISPGFLGVVPSSERVTITFGSLGTWKFGVIVSLLSIGIWLAIFGLTFLRSRLR